MTKGLYTIHDDLYKNALSRYIENNRCVLGWKIGYNVEFNGVTYRKVKGIDIVPGEYLEISRGDNPIKLKIGKPNSIIIDKTNMTIRITMKNLL